jgi:RHS repeat-associated core domain
MAGISSNALKGLNYPENRRKYNGNELQSKEFGDGSGLEWYDFNARIYDEQIGRFLRIDPASELAYNLTGYRFGFNNPVLHSDPSGLWEGTYNRGDAGFDQLLSSLQNGTFNINDGDNDKDKDKKKSNSSTAAEMQFYRDFAKKSISHKEDFNRRVGDAVDLMKKASNDPDFYENSALYSGQFYGATLPILDPALVEQGFMYTFVS